MKIGEITAYLETLAPPIYQESYDNAGLVVGNSSAECTGALLCLDSIEAVVDEAITKNCNLIIAHHPILFVGLKSLTGRNYIERTLLKAIKNDIAIFNAHTNLDNVHIGVNKKICDKLGLVNTQILAPKSATLKKLYTFCPINKVGEVRDAIFSTGAGTIGNYDQCSFNVEGYGTFRAGQSSRPYVGKRGEMHKEQEVKIEILFPIHLESQIIQGLKSAHPYEEVAYDIIALSNTNPQIGAGMIGELKEEQNATDFLQHLKKSMHTDCIRHTTILNKPIQKVAVCGGAGSFLLNAAIRQKADIFITGDYKYHQFFDADGRIIIADIGHYESEQFTVELFHQFLSEKFANFAVLFSEVNSNPVKYL